MSFTFKEHMLNLIRKLLKINILGYTEKTKTIMRRCIYEAGLTKRIGTPSLQFITERKEQN